MKWGHKRVLASLGIVSILLTATHGRRAAAAEVRQDGLLGIVVEDAFKGAPIGNASVDVRRLDGVSCGSVVSDANGVAWIHLLPGQYEIFDADGEGYTYEGPRQLVTMVPGLTDRVVMALTPNVHGVVRDPAGTPIVRASVKVVGAGREEVTSDGQGRYDIAWDRRCRLRDVPTLCLVARHERRNLGVVTEIGQSTSFLDVTLQPCAPLTGRIVDPDGRGIAGGWVCLTLSVANWGEAPLCDEHVKADSGGRFEIRAVPPGRRYTVHAYADGYGGKDAVADVRTAAALDVGSLTLPRASLSVTGRVLDTEGNPLANARVRGWGSGQPIKLDARTDAAGWFKLGGVCAGRVGLRVDSEWVWGVPLATMASADGGATNVEIVVYGRAL
jgi:hypothetical protein